MGTVLIVDDDFDVRVALQDVLEDEGYAVAIAADGLDALDYLRANQEPCLILLDWMMPRCNGESFRLEQQKDPRVAGIPVVLLTADPRTEMKMKQLELDTVLQKPVDLDELLAIVGRYCARASG